VVSLVAENRGKKKNRAFPLYVGKGKRGRGSDSKLVPLHAALFKGEERAGRRIGGLKQIHEQPKNKKGLALLQIKETGGRRRLPAEKRERFVFA